MSYKNHFARTVLAAVLFLAVFSPPTNGSSLPIEGTISADSVSASVYVFDGVAVSDDVGFGSVDFDMSQSPTSGQITGDGSIDLNSVTYAQNYIYGSADLNGSMTFSAKPVRRGNIVTLAGAKVAYSTKGTGSVSIYDYGSWNSYAFTFSSVGGFTFSSLSMDLSGASIALGGVVSAGKLSVTGTGYYSGRLMKKTVSIPYTKESFSTALPASNVWKLNVGVSELAVNSKGVVTGYADSLLDMADTITNGYKISGSRNAKTGITKLTITGVSSSVKGTSAKVNVDDDLNLKTGKGYSNSLSIYGNSLTF